jgi:glutathione S-transferase
MLKLWGRNSSINVQKVLWALGELGLSFERIDVGGSFGKNREPAYLAMNPNGLVPTLEEEDGFLLWESNTIVRYLAIQHGLGSLGPAGPRGRARASQWMDWQLSVASPAIHGLFWGMIRTPPEKRDHAAIDASRAKTIDAMKILDGELAKNPYVAGDAFSMGDIPVGLVTHRFRHLVPERSGLDNLERWYIAISSRPAFREQIAPIPIT